MNIAIAVYSKKFNGVRERRVRTNMPYREAIDYIKNNSTHALIAYSPEAVNTDSYCLHRYTTPAYDREYGKMKD